MSASVLQRTVQARGAAAVAEALTPAERAALQYAWPLVARPEQLPPGGNWRTWLLKAGRGFGKTRAGAEWVRAEVEAGRRGRLALVAPTAADTRDVMVEGESGIMAISPPGMRPVYSPSTRRLTWPNGAMATTYSADEPDRLRGPQHDGAWSDEISVWRYPEAWDMLQLGLRLGTDPRQVVTTTPKPTRLVRELLKASSTIVTGGSTYDNSANLAAAFLAEIASRYEGTRLGRQELYAELLEDVEGALWKREWMRVKALPHPFRHDAGGREFDLGPDLARIVVAVDPASTGNANSDETGIIVCARGNDGFGYVMADRSCRMSPDGWARRAVSAYHEYHADRIIAEKNQGGEMVGLVLAQVDANVPVSLVHASRGKQARAEPVSALYEQGRVFHTGAFPDLEDQLCTWTPDSGESPDRLDALVWGMTELMLQPEVNLRWLGATGEGEAMKSRWGPLEDRA